MCTFKPVSGRRHSISSLMKKSWRIGMAIEELEASIDAVVIGDGHQIHAARFRDAVHRLGVGIAVARA